MAFLVEVIVDLGVDRTELLQRLHSTKSEHHPLSSSQRQVTVLSPIIRPAANLAAIGIAELPHVPIAELYGSPHVIAAQGGDGRFALAIPPG